MMVSAILIPLGFRAVFGFLNVPMRLELQPKIHLDAIKALANPTFLVLYPKSIFASYALTFTILAGVFAYRAGRGDGRAELYAGKFAKLGLAFLVLTAVLGAVYAETLRIFAPYKFDNAFGMLLGINAKYDVSWMLLLKIAFVSIQFAAIVYFLKSRGVRSAEVAGAAGIGAVFIGEMLNAFSQYPLLIANVSGLPPAVVKSLEGILNMAKPNPLTTMSSLYAITLAFLIPLLICFGVLIYLVSTD